VPLQEQHGCDIVGYFGGNWGDLALRKLFATLYYLIVTPSASRRTRILALARARQNSAYAQLYTRHGQPVITQGDLIRANGHSFASAWIHESGMSAAGRVPRLAKAWAQPDRVRAVLIWRPSQFIRRRNSQASGSVGLTDVVPYCAGKAARRELGPQADQTTQLVRSFDEAAVFRYRSRTWARRRCRICWRCACGNALFSAVAQLRISICADQRNGNSRGGEMRV